MTDPLILIIIAIIVLIFLSAFFSGSETALTGTSRPRMHQLERDGNRRAHVVNQLHRRQERLIGGILVGNNIVNISASALATSILIGWFGDAGIAYATIIMTLLVLVFAEVLPKTYAIRHADRVALRVAPILKPVIMFLSPITRLVEALVLVLLHLAGDRRVERSRKAREEELRGAIRLHHALGDETAIDEGVMLRAILDLDDIEVGEIMTHRTEVHMVDANLPAAQVVAQVLASPYTRLPLYRNDPDNVIGVLHAKALLRDVQDHDGRIEEMEIPAVATKPWFVPESTDCLSQLQAFRNRREHFALVVDEYGSLQGVVTLEDILEEIVGEIVDEHDIPVAGLHPQPDGSYIVDGRVTIRDLNRELGWDLPDEEAATVAGLVLHEARLIPEEGQSFAFYGFRFDVLRRKANQILSLRISPRSGAADTTPAPPEEAADKADDTAAPEKTAS